MCFTIVKPKIVLFQPFGIPPFPHLTSPVKWARPHAGASPYLRDSALALQASVADASDGTALGWALATLRPAPISPWHTTCAARRRVYLKVKVGRKEEGKELLKSKIGMWEVHFISWWTGCEVELANSLKCESFGYEPLFGTRDEDQQSLSNSKRHLKTVTNQNLLWTVTTRPIACRCSHNEALPSGRAFKHARQANANIPASSRPSLASSRSTVSFSTWPTSFKPSWATNAIRHDLEDLAMQPRTKPRQRRSMAIPQLGTFSLSALRRSSNSSSSTRNPFSDKAFTKSFRADSSWVSAGSSK